MNILLHMHIHSYFFNCSNHKGLILLQSQLVGRIDNDAQRTTHDAQCTCVSTIAPKYERRLLNTHTVQVSIFIKLVLFYCYLC